MKRIFSIAIAAMLILNMAVGAFADTDPAEYCVTGIWDKGYLLDDDDNYVDFSECIDDRDSVSYGETVYYPLIHVCADRVNGDACTHTNVPIAVYESRATKSIKIKTDWDEGKSYIDELSIVRKKYDNENNVSGLNFDTANDSSRCYFLAVTLKQRSSTTTSTYEVDGNVKLKKSSGGNKDDYFDYDDDVEVDVTFEVGYTNPEDSNTIPKTPALFEPDDDFDEDSEETFDFEADDDSYFIVNTNGQKKLVLGMDTDYDNDIADRFPEADLYFFNGNGGRFNKIGYLYIYDNDIYKYAYSVNDKGNLELVKTTRDDDCLVIRTRTLGRYVLSDVKLNIPDPVVEEDEKAVIFDNNTQTNHNPGTGGWGFDDIAYNGWGETQAAAAPAIVTAESKTEEAASPSEKAEGKTETKAESTTKKKDEAKVEKTSAKSAVDAKATTVKVNGNVVEEGLNTRAMLLICCCVGAGASALGLIFCLFAAIAKSRNNYNR